MQLARILLDGEKSYFIISKKRSTIWRIVVIPKSRNWDAANLEIQDIGIAITRCSSIYWMYAANISV